VNRFVIIAEKDANGDLLSKFLSNHPEIQMKGEIFKGRDTNAKDHDYWDAQFKDEEKYKAIGFLLYEEQVSSWISDYINGHIKKCIVILNGELKNNRIDKRLGIKFGHIMEKNDIKVSKDNKWRKIIVRRSLLIDFLEVLDKVLPL